MHKLKDKTELEKLLILNFIIGGSLTFISCIAFIWGIFGITVGLFLGLIISTICTILLYKGSEATLKADDMKLSSFLLFYFGRMVLYLLGLLFAVLMQYVAKIEFLSWCWIGVVAAYLPPSIVVKVVMSKNGRNSITIGADD